MVLKAVANNSGGSPGGSNTQVQYNNSGIFGGISGAMSDGTNMLVTTQSSTDNSTKVASTAYVNTAVINAIAGINPAIAVQAATTQASDTSGFTYNNGVSGIGATLTGSINTAVTIDGYTFTTLGQRLLVKNDTQSPSGAFNGLYSLTVLQTSLLAPVFTRDTDYNTPSNINNTGAIPVVSGTANALTSWLLTSQVTTIGTDPLTYSKFTINPTMVTPANLGGTGIANNVASTITISGNFGTTLTIAGTTSITLPTSGTLATTAGNVATATALQTARAIYGNNFDGTAALTQIIASTYGGTGNGFTKFSGAASSEKTYTLPNATCNVLTDNALVTVAQGGTGAGTLTGILKGNGTSAFTAATAGTDFVAPGTVTNFTAQQYFGNATLTDASTVTWNLNTQAFATLLSTSGVGSTRKLGNPSNMVNGGTYVVIYKQDSSGSRLLTFDTSYKFPGGTAFVASTAANAIDVLTFVSDGANMYTVGQKGFA